MNLLLDTHVLLWWLQDSSRLSQPVRKRIRGAARIYVSAATAWEVSIKKALGKLDAPDDLRRALAACHFDELPITVAHALAAGALPHHHEDPFDRLLVAQAKAEDLTLLTADKRLEPYGPPVTLTSSMR